MSQDRRFSIDVQGRDLWFDLYASMEILAPDSISITPVYSLRPFDHPFANAFEMQFHADQPWDSSAVVCFRDAVYDGKWYYLGHERSNEGRTLRAEALSFEDFTVVLDTVPPNIVSSYPDDEAIVRNRQPLFSCVIEDTLSGVNFDELRFEVDDVPVIWEFDGDRNELRYVPWERLSPGIHSWKVSIPDQIGNRIVLDRIVTIR